MSTTTPSATTDLKCELLRIAKEMYESGPGYAQEQVVLREAAEQFRLNDLGQQQQLLRVWHRLFYDGDLVWGYDVDNPGPPFYHFAGDR